MQEFTLEIFYNSLKEFVQHQQAFDNENCRRLNSFLVVDDSFDFGSDYVEKYKRDSWYFSRSNTEIVFPALFISEFDEPLSNFKNGSYQRYTHSIEIGVIDKFVEKKAGVKCTQCDKRTEQQVLRDAKDMLRRVLNEIANITLFKINNLDLKYSYEGVIQALKDANKINTSQVITKETKSLLKKWEDNNPSPIIRDFKIIQSQLYGGFASVRISEICTSGNFIFKHKEVEKTSCC